MNTYLKAMMMPLWGDCPWEVPPGVMVHSDGLTAVFIAGGKTVGVNISNFDKKRIPEILSRLGVAASRPSPGPV